MYVQQTNACNEPNSETPITAAQIAGQYAYGDRMGRPFVRGNSIMSNLVDGLTPPVPTGQCSDFTNSNSMFALTPWPVPAPAGAVGAPATPDTGAVTPAASVIAAAAGTPSAAASPATAAPAGGAYTYGPRRRLSTKGYSARYPYGSIVDQMAQFIPSYGCAAGSSGAPAPIAAGGDISSLASSGTFLWAALLGLGLWFAFSGKGAR